jgi:diguanylate cyclase (GGDEF)-like protein
MSSAAEAFVAQLRLDARHDRQEALRDREASATGRSDASNDRHDATGDRTSSAADRHAAEGDREEAALDALTGVYTRLAGFVQLEREMARAYRAHAPLAVAFIDVDGLKAVNDRHGHLAGDNLLRAVVRTLRDHMRTEDLIFRYGGDEFICVFSGLAATHATRRIEDVNRALSDRPEHSSVSAGISELRRPDSVTDLICRADAALYRGRRLASRR